MVKVMKNTERGGERRNKGAWTAEEDKKLVDYVRIHGDRRWRTLPAKAGLNRCGKSCRLRWLNYLRPGIKRGNISEDEEDMIIRLQNLLGNRWSLIAGRLPGRTDNEIKNHWNTHLSKKSLTIRDLNSKLHRMLESNHNGLSPSSISSALTSGFREEAPVCHAQPWVETTSHQMFDMDEILNLSFPPEFGDVASLDHCLGLSKIWFPSPQPMAPENFDFDDITRFMDYKDCFFYLP